jgi:hypothetical protein
MEDESEELETVFAPDTTSILSGMSLTRVPDSMAHRIFTDDGVPATAMHILLMGENEDDDRRVLIPFLVSLNGMVRLRCQLDAYIETFTPEERTRILAMADQVQPEARDIQRTASAMNRVTACCPQHGDVDLPHVCEHGSW